VAGPQAAAVASVIDPSTGSTSTLEPAGVRPFDPDGLFLAATAEVGGNYRLIVFDLANGFRVLDVPLPVAAPGAPPYLTWLDDVIVAADVTGTWPTPSINAHLRRCSTGRAIGVTAPVLTRRRKNRGRPSRPGCLPGGCGSRRWGMRSERRA
jgi:hypothetical protein